MTSKEALDCLVYSYLGDKKAKKKVDENYGEIINLLLTDIEVLEIIKKYWDIEINNLQVSISYKSTSPMDTLPIREVNKLKEWKER